MEIVKCINYINAFILVTICIISISPREGERYFILITLVALGFRLVSCIGMNGVTNASSSTFLTY